MKEMLSDGMGKEEFLGEILNYNPHADVKKIGAAYDFAKAAHAGQRRESGQDFFLHVRECAYLVATMKLDTDAICAALLHDILEDTKTKEETVERLFGNEVLRLVQGVTKEINNKAIQHYRAENIRKVLLATAKDVRVIVIKLADRLHNMRTLKYLPLQTQKEIAKETLEIYVPIAYKLGMYRIKSELEDLCLKHLQPEIYQQLKKRVAKKKAKREEEVNRIIKAVRKVLGEAGIEAKVYGRAKNFYSIYKKMMRKGLEFEDIKDLSAVRIIVKNSEECYKALNAIHSKWQPVTEKFDDYIKNPKPNLYQSLHTEVVFNKKPVEVQIRTREMHHVAEEGIAAHWQYKDTARDKKFDRRIAWLKQILDWRSAETAHELVESFKIDIFKDEIYVVTPKGDPIPLPEKSTPVDFAYAVHTEIGNQCKSAKVNGSIQPLNYELKSGDVVEILTTKNSKPSRQWLNFAKTSFAREKIRKALGIKAESVRRARDITATNDISSKEKMPLKLQKCCYIRYGDDITGQKTKDAISIHSARCDVAKGIPEERKVKLEWKQQESRKHLEIELKDRTGIFADILGTLTSDDIKINSVDTKAAKHNLRLILEISSENEQLAKTLPKLKQVTLA
ncbi:bifunctional (p)ppGpp synthetase/guanosine-3',5'-bis(diphosphate) 3'-pyrophosphohydrolase [Candidatus Woesearchaeota archaeon]|nr:bifunctional (p)ppGpp synthetase/guanosine-3',5'-bis(diphosphate) 3'-pyrophosphohydrolase [Candidatus Woesearchaeota archaeon]